MYTNVLSGEPTHARSGPNGSVRACICGLHARKIGPTSPTRRNHPALIIHKLYTYAEPRSIFKFFFGAVRCRDPSLQNPARAASVLGDHIMIHYACLIAAPTLARWNNWTEHFMAAILGSDRGDIEGWGMCLADSGTSRPAL
jgi:hypothetical protein